MRVQGSSASVVEEKKGGITVKHSESLISAQGRNEKEFLDAISSGKHTFDDPYIMVNPYIINPLAAIIGFKADKSDVGKELSLTVQGRVIPGGMAGGEVEDKKVGIDLHFTFPVTAEMVVPVLGLYAEEKTHLVLTLGGKKRELDVSAEKIDLGNYAHVISVDSEPRYLGERFILLSTATSKYSVGVDENGDVRWLIDRPYAWDTREMRNGRFLMGGIRYLRSPYYMADQLEASLTGKIYRQFNLPGGSHHDAVELANGNIVVCSNDFSRDAHEDIAYEIDRKTGKIVDTFDMRAVLYSERGKGPGLTALPGDWFHNNSIDYLPEKDWLLFSGRHSDTLVCMNRAAKKVEWIIGDPETWPEEYQKYFFTPIGHPFDWPYAQHSGLFVSATEIICFDNHTQASKVKGKAVLNKDNYSRGVGYRIDTEKMTIEQIWEQGKELGNSFFSAFISNVEKFGENHYMVHSGGIGHDVHGRSVAGVPLLNHAVTLYSRTVCKKDGKTVFDMTVDTDTYRAKIFDFTYGTVLEMGKGQSLGTLGVEEEFETIPETSKTATSVPEHYNLVVDDEDDRIIFRGIFQKGQMVMLLANDGTKVHPYFVATSVSGGGIGSLGLCVGTFVTENASVGETERSVAISLSKAGWSSPEAELSLIIDDVKYDLGVKVSQGK